MGKRVLFSFRHSNWMLSSILKECRVANVFFLSSTHFFSAAYFLCVFFHQTYFIIIFYSSIDKLAINDTSNRSLSTSHNQKETPNHSKRLEFELLGGQIAWSLSIRAILTCPSVRSIWLSVCLTVCLPISSSRFLQPKIKIIYALINFCYVFLRDALKWWTRTRHTSRVLHRTAATSGWMLADVDGWLLFPVAWHIASFTCLLLLKFSPKAFHWSL